MQKRIHRLKRKDHLGQLVQINATPYEWFGTFRSPNTGKLTVEDMIAGKRVNLTPFGRSMHELDIDLVEFAMRGIQTVSSANEFLTQEYRQLFNQKFSVKAQDEPPFVKLRAGLDIDEILCIKHSRKTDNAGTFSFKNRCFQILDKEFPIISSRKEIQVLIHPRYGIRVCYQDKSYEAIRYFKPQRKDSKTKPRYSKKSLDAVTPHLKHRSEAWRKIWWQEDYNQSLKFLYELFFEKQQSAS